MHYADSDSDIHRIGSPYDDILLGCRMVLSVTAEHYAICACHFYNLVYVNLLVYRVSFFCAFLQQSACRFAFFFGYESFCFIYSFRLDTVLDSLTLRHGSAESLCWRVSLDLPFLSLHRQNKGTTLIVSFQCVCVLYLLFFAVFFLNAGCSSVGAKVSGTRRGVSLLASAINCGGGYSQGYNFG